MRAAHPCNGKTGRGCKGVRTGGYIVCLRLEMECTASFWSNSIEGILVYVLHPSACRRLGGFHILSSLTSVKNKHVSRKPNSIDSKKVKYNKKKENVITGVESHTSASFNSGKNAICDILEEVHIHLWFQGWNGDTLDMLQIDLWLEHLVLTQETRVQFPDWELFFLLFLLLPSLIRLCSVSFTK